MTSEDFSAWLVVMKQRGFNKLACAEMLGRSPQWVALAQKRGSDRVTALACTALLAGGIPFTAASAASSGRKSKRPVTS